MAGPLYGVTATGFGEGFTLASSEARTADGNGLARSGFGRFRRLLLLLNVTAAAADAGDTLDVFVDGSLDGSVWFNMAHFTQVVGNGGAVRHVAVLDPSNPGTSVIAVATDASAGDVRPALFAPYLRARWAIVDSGDADQSFTFSVTGYGQ